MEDREKFDSMMEDFGDSEGCRVALAALFVGPSQKRIAAFTGLSRDRVAEPARRLRSNGVWVGDKISCEGEYPDAIEVALWALVADGMLEAAPA